MNYQLSSVTKYLTSFWKSEAPKTDHTFLRQSDYFQQQVTDVSTQRLNQLVSNIMPGCTSSEATLRKTQEDKLSFYSESIGTVIFSNEKTMDEWLADKQMVDIWKIEDQRIEKSEVLYKLQRHGEWGYDTFKAENELFDRLRADYGVFWKLVDPEQGQTSYIRFKTGIFGNYYEKVDPANLIYVVNNLELKTGSHPHTTTSPASSRTSWGKGTVACVLGGLLLSAGRSWTQNFSEVSLSNAIAMMKETLGPAAFKAALVFQMSAIVAASRHGEGKLPSALFAGMMLLPKLVKSQSLCPQLAGSYDTPDWAWGVAVSGNYAYVADQLSGLQIIDISNVTNPTFASFYNTSGSAYGVAVSGNYAYVADDTSGLQIIDISSVAIPTLAGFYDTPDEAYGIAISGNYAYVGDGDSGLQIIDVSNVTNPTLAGFCITPGSAYGVAISGNYAYVADVSYLQIIDISNVATPTLAGFYNTPGAAWGVAVSGNYAYVADGTSGLQIIDISNVTTPTLAGFYNTPGDAWDVVLSGNYAYVADQSSGLWIIDVSNVANPTLAGLSGAPDFALGVAVSGNYAYVTDGSSGLQIISIPCPTSTTSSSLTTSSTSTMSSTFSTTTSSASSISSTSTSFSTSSTTSFSTFQITTENLSSTSETNNNVNWTLRVVLISATACGIIFLLGIVIAPIIVAALFLNKRRRKNENQIEMERNREVAQQNLTMLEPILSNHKNPKSFELEAIVKRSHKEIGKKYYQLSSLKEEEVREIYLQTGHLIIFPEGQDKLKYAIGKGNFGAIKIAQRIEDGQYVASKKIQGEGNIQASEAEANRQRKAAGANILPIYNTIKLPDALYHFMPLAGLGDGCAIQQRLATLSDAKTVTEILHFVANDLLMGLRTLHGKGMCHLDIKPDNLVFTKEGIGSITDFGCAKEAAITQIPADALGDTRYFSPERLHACGNDKTFDGEKADMWAAGMVLLQIMKNMLPLQLLDMPGPLKLRVQKCDANYFHEKLMRFIELSTAQEGTILWVIKSLLDPNPKTRFTAQEALEASCFKSLDNSLREGVFNGLRKEMIAKSRGGRKEEINLNDYEVAASTMMKGNTLNFYNSEDYQQFYNNTELDRNQDYIVTAENEAPPPYPFSNVPIYNNMTSDDSVYNNATPDNPIYNN